jgi:FkbM family methyltransferase
MMKLPLKAFQSIRADVRDSQSVGRSMWSLATYHALRRLPIAKEHLFSFQYDKMPFHARTQDYWTIEEVLLSQEYRFLDAILQGQPTSCVVLDCGANIGMFGVYVLTHCPTAIVHSVEASSPTYRVLKSNADSLPDRWSAYHAALWHSNGEVEFVNEADNLASHIAYDADGHKAPSPQVEKVPALRLDTFCDQHCLDHIHILKIDIEGAAQAALEACESTLDSVDHLLIEIHPPYEDRETLATMFRRHFPYVHILPPSHQSDLSLMVASRSLTSIPS